MTAPASRERRALPPGVKPESLETGDSLPLFQAGGPYIYLLESGIALVERNNFFGEWDNLGYRRPDSIFGEMLEDARALPYYKRVTALQDSNFLRIERALLKELSQTASDIATHLREAVMQDAYATEDRLALVTRTTLAERLPAVLLDLTEGGATRILLSQGLIGKAAGGERPTVNQMMMGYRRRGILLDEKGIAINGEDGLRALRALSERTVPFLITSNSRTQGNGSSVSMIPN